MNKKQEQQILDYYSTNDKYVRNKTQSNAHQTVFTKESDKYQWLVLEQKSQCEVEVRQTDNHGTITARDNYETGEISLSVREVWYVLGRRCKIFKYLLYAD